ncbi:MAG: VWA domain-containing protein, partial [Acidobacteriaceae bacterium]|nr:VWA domain-containing protein [Acidobacteriaceae bacterium]
QSVGSSDPAQDMDEQQRAYNARSMLVTLQKVAEWFGSVRGRRKTMLLFSEGIDYNLNDIIRAYDQPSSQASSIIEDIRETIAATARSNVSIYAIDPRGLTSGNEDDITVGQFADSDNPSAGIGQGSLRNELQMAQDSLRTLSEETGGFAAVNRNDTREAFDRIVRDNSSYYVLAYYPASNRRDGKLHKIEVKTTRPGLTVRARRGYVAPKGKPAPPPKTGGMPLDMYETINSPLPVSGLMMRVFAMPFKGAEPNASVLLGVEMRGRDLTLDANSKVEVSYLAVDTKDKVFGARNDALTLNLRPESRTRVEQSGVRLFNRIDIPPGRYQVRIAAKDTAKGALGSVIYDLEVPDFYKQPLAMSGVAITSLGSGAMMTAKLDDELKAVLPAPPIGQRVFPQNDELAIFAEIYDNNTKAPHKVDVLTSIITDDGRVLYKNVEERDSSELKGAKGAYGFTARIPLSEIPPGLYVLNVEAHSRTSSDTGVGRQIQFEVVPAQR